MKTAQVIFEKYKFHLIILCCTVIIRLFFLVVAPSGQTVTYHIEGLNDEPSHFNYTKYLSENHSFPIQTESTQSKDAFKHNVYEYYQPPLYYALCSLFYSSLGEKGTLYFGRFLSFVFGILSLVILIKILDLLRFEKSMSIIAFLFASLQLSHVYFSSLFSNDSMSWFLCIAIIYALLTVIDNKNSNRNNVSYCDLIITLLIIAGMYVKSSLVIFIPVYAIVMSIIYINDKDRRILIQRMVLLCSALIVISPWYIRNYIVYHSIFAFETGFGPPGNGSLGVSNILTAINATVKMFFFPMQHVPVTSITKCVNYTGIALILINILLVSKYLWKKIRNDAKFQVLALVLLLSLVSYFSLLTQWFNAEGRYLFTAFCPIVLFLIPSDMSEIKFRNVFKVCIAIELLFGYSYFFFT